MRITHIALIKWKTVTTCRQANGEYKPAQVNPRFKRRMVSRWSANVMVPPKTGINTHTVFFLFLFLFLR